MPADPTTICAGVLVIPDELLETLGGLRDFRACLAEAAGDSAAPLVFAASVWDAMTQDQRDAVTDRDLDRRLPAPGGRLPSTITIDLDWSHHLVDHHRSLVHGIDGDPEEEYSTSPLTPEDLILRQAAELLALRAWQDQDTRTTLTRRAEQTLTELIGARVDEHVTAFLTQPQQPTTRWGEPAGEPVTLAERIETAVKVALTTVAPRGPRDRGDDQRTRLERSIDTHVQAEVGPAIMAAVGQAREAIAAKVAAAAGDVLTEGLRRVVLDTPAPIPVEVCGKPTGGGPCCRPVGHGTEDHGCEAAF